MKSNETIKLTKESGWVRERSKGIQWNPLRIRGYLNARRFSDPSRQNSNLRDNAWSTVCHSWAINRPLGGLPTKFQVKSLPKFSKLLSETTALGGTEFSLINDSGCLEWSFPRKASCRLKSIQSCNYLV